MWKWTLSSCVQFLTNKCSTQSAMKSLNEKVGVISKSGKSPKKGGDQKSIPRSPANEGEKEKQKPTPEALKKQKEVETYIKDKKLLHICWKCKQDAIDGLKKMSEIKEYPKCIEHNTRAIKEEIPAKKGVVDDSIDNVRGYLSAANEALLEAYE